MDLVGPRSEGREGGRNALSLSVEPMCVGGPVAGAADARGSGLLGGRGGGRRVTLLEDRDVLVDPLLGQRVPEDEGQQRDQQQADAAGQQQAPSQR
mgnify:CR=1 FL=1